MIPRALLADVVLAFAAVALLYAAVMDLKHNKIGNELILLLVGLFIAHTFLSDHWFDTVWSIGLATFIFAFLIYFYSRNWMGGGDVKMLTVAFMWSGLHRALAFAILLFVFAALHTAAARLGLVNSEQRRSDDVRARIALAPSVAAALIGVFILGCLRSSL